jgi:hypothetical protein
MQKKPQFFSFAIPIEVSGNFDDFHGGVSPVNILKTVVQLSTSVVWVPIQYNRCLEKRHLPMGAMCARQ